MILLPDGNLAAGSFKKIFIWDITAQNGQLKEILDDGHDDCIRALVVLPKHASFGLGMASGSDDKTIRIWNC